MTPDLTAALEKAIKSLKLALNHWKQPASEDPHSYVDSDGEGWGPALGAAAYYAKKRNLKSKRDKKKCEAALAELERKLRAAVNGRL